MSWVSYHVVDNNKYQVAVEDKTHHRRRGQVGLGDKNDDA